MLGTYLTDHLGGAQLGCEHARRLVELFERDAAFGPQMARIAGEIEDDRETLERLAGRVGAQRSAVKDAGAWVGEKLARVKFLAARAQDDDFERFLALEVMSLGVEGKRCLWLALERAAPPALGDVDFAALAARAAGQRERLEAKRLELAVALHRDTATAEQS